VLSVTGALSSLRLRADAWPRAAYPSCLRGEWRAAVPLVAVVIAFSGPTIADHC
jgi:hypothetical protein